MAEQWYWKHRGNLLGPLKTEELEELIRHHRIAERDELRLADSDEWLTGKEIKALFTQREASTSSAAAERLLSQAGHRHRSRQVEGVSGGSPLASFGKYTARGMAGLLERIADGLTAAVGLLMGLVKRKIALAILMIVLLSVLLKGVDLGGQTFNRRIFRELTATGDQVQAMQARDASVTEYLAFQDQTLPLLDATLQSLMDEAEREYQRSYWIVPWPGSALRRLEIRETRRELITAVRVLRTIVGDLPASTGSLDQGYLACMSRAQECLSGEFRRNLIAARNAAKNSEQSQRLDPQMAGILTLDGLLVVGGVIYWFRRRKN